jgi:multidrug efflux pump subunit AcrB
LVDVAGYLDREVWVEVDPRKLNALNLKFTNIINAIKKRNQNLPSGTFDSGPKELLIRSMGEVKEAKDIERIIVSSYSEGVVTVGDMADVTETFEEEEFLSRFNGRRAIVLTVKKSSSGDVVDIANEVKRIVKNEDAHLEDDINLTLAYDESKYVEKRLEALLLNAVLGIILVILILYAFLDSRVAFWASMGIPFSFLLTIVIMSFMGITLNLLSMFALILVLGIVVDDAIVVSENFFRYREMGYNLTEAVVLGTQEVIKPIVAAIATNIAAFIPLLFITGIMGKFLKTIPIVVIITLLASLLEAFFILPSHLNEFVTEKGNETNKEARAWFNRIRDLYGNLLVVVLKRRYIVFSTLVGVAIVTIIFGIFTMKFVFMGKSIAEKFRVSINLPTDSNLEETDRVVKKFEEIILGRSGDEISVVVTSVGGPSSSYKGQFSVELTEHGYKKIGAEKVIANIREETDLIAGPTSIGLRLQRRGPPTGSAVEVSIQGDEFSTLLKLSEDFKVELASMKGVVDIDDDYRRGKEEIQFLYDEYAMGTLGLNVNDVAEELRNAFSGGKAGTMKRGTDKIDIIVKYNEEMANLNNLMNFSVSNNNGDRIPIKTFADVDYRDGMLSIYHDDRKRTISVTANIVEGENTSKAVNETLIKKFGLRSDKYPGYTFKYGGEYEDTMESILSLLRALFMTILLIYIILAALFRSYVQPLIIMITVPFSFIGVVFGLFIMNIELSLMAGIGIIALIGIVVNDSIVMVDFINRARDKGMNLYDAVIETGKVRLRPILLTSFTTIGGLLPMAIGIGGREPMLTPMAVSIVWGLAFAVLLTLVVIPCLYIIVEDIKQRFVKR